MQLSSALNVQNRGTFQIENTALKADQSNSDRQFSGESYMMFDDQMDFSRISMPTEQPQEELHPVTKVINHLFNMDTRFYLAFIPTALFSCLVQAFSSNTLLTVSLSLVFFVVWYIMSFFNFNRTYHTLMNGPRVQAQF